MTLAPGETVKFVFLIGQAASADDARALIFRTRAADLAATLSGVKQHRADLLGAVQVQSPDSAMGKSYASAIV